MPIIQKIATIQAALPPIEKKGKGPASQGGYAFIKVEDIITALKPQFNAHQIVVKTETLSESHDFHFGTDTYNLDGQVTGDGRVRQVRVAQRVLMRFTFIDAEDGSEFPVEVLGEAFDTSDKATRKAITQAHKVALMQTFQIHDGEIDADAIDPVADSTKAPAEPKQDRGAQSRAAAANGGRGRPAAVKPAAEAKPAPDLTPEAPPTPAPEQSKPAAKPTKEEQIQAIADALPEGPWKSPWTPDPADVEHAQKNTPAARAVEHVAKAEAEYKDQGAAPEPSAGPVAREEDGLDKAKARLRAAVAGTGGIGKAEVDAIGREALGKERAEWITSARDIAKIAERIENGELASGEQQAA